jgi:hypothetical protein
MRRLIRPCQKNTKTFRHENINTERVKKIQKQQRQQRLSGEITTGIFRDNRHEN